MKNFDYCLPLLFKDEGGYGNDIGDDGGPTKYGITIGDVRRYIKKDATAEDVRALSLDQAKAIYKSKYWDALSCDTLPNGVDYACFDYGVNSGLGRPRSVLKKFSDLSGHKLIDAICDERVSFLKTISNPSNPKYAHNSKFRNGWLARVERVRKASHGLVKDNVSGPASSAASVLTLWAALNQYIHSHPYVVIGGSVAVAAIIGTLIHLYRNRK